jgi:hypothetical protein
MATITFNVYGMTFNMMKTNKLHWGIFMMNSQEKNIIQINQPFFTRDTDLVFSFYYYDYHLCK